MSRFETEFVKPFNLEVERVKGFSATVVADTAENVFGAILDLWPKDTFWSAANHRINIGKVPGQNFPVSPPKRPSEAGALTGEASANENEQIGKLAGVKFGDSVLIGNAVPYAGDIAFKKGNGARIYHEAGNIGAAQIISRIG